MEKWLEVIQHEELSKLSENEESLKKLQEKRVCSKHFLQSDFVHTSTRILLKRYTVPQSSLSSRVPEVTSNVSNNVLSNEPSLDESIHFNSFNENTLNLAVNLETFPEQSNDDDVPAAESENNASLSLNLPNQQAPIKRKRKKCVPPVSTTLNKLKLRMLNY